MRRASQPLLDVAEESEAESVPALRTFLVDAGDAGRWTLDARAATTSSEPYDSGGLEELEAQQPEEAEGCASTTRAWLTDAKAHCSRLLLEEHDELAQLCRVACVEALLLICFGTTRLACLLRLPSDAKRDDDGGAVAEDFQELLQLGFALALLTKLHTVERFAWFSARPIYAVVFLGTPFVFGGFNEIPGLQVSLATIGSWGGVAWFVMLFAALVLLLVIGWHARRSFLLPRRERVAYLASRLAVYAFFVLQWTMMKLSPPGRRGYEQYHLHHYYIGFLVALWGCFDHPISALLLSIGAGIMAQGLGAYHDADLFTATLEGTLANARAAGCLTLRLNSSLTRVQCAFEPRQANHSWGFFACPWGDFGEAGRPNGTCISPRY